jgi:hypothetical protein
MQEKSSILMRVDQSKKTDCKDLCLIARRIAHDPADREDNRASLIATGVAQMNQFDHDNGRANTYRDEDRVGVIQSRQCS